jgi:hypothetical protein
MSEETAFETKEVGSLTDEELSNELSQTSKEAPAEEVAETPIETGTPQTSEVEPDKKVVSETKEPEDFKFDDTKYRNEGWTEAQIKIKKSDELQIFHKQKLIEKQSLEVGLARKRSEELARKEAELAQKKLEIDQRLAVAEDNFYDDKAGYSKVIADKIKLEQEQREIETQKIASHNEKEILSRVPELESLMDNEILEVIKQDSSRLGLSDLDAENTYREFKQTWKTFPNTQTILYIAERAKLFREIKQRDEKIKALSHTPDTVGKNIAKIASQRPVVKAGVTDTNASLKDPRFMTDAEIEAELKALE